VKGFAVNTASRFAVERETDALAQSDLMRRAPPTLPVSVAKG
jgi:hypothetical protein